MAVLAIVGLATGCSSTPGTATIASPQAATVVTVTVSVTTVGTLDVSRPAAQTVTQTVTTTETVGASGPSVKVFDHIKVQQGVTDVLAGSPPTGYGLSGVSDVMCPANQPVKAGTTFECSVAISGAARSVTVTVKDDNGTYEVSPPK
jgi:hypothetical protein